MPTELVPESGWNKSLSNRVFLELRERVSSLESASPFRRTLMRIIAAIDYALLTLPVVEKLGGISVLYGRAPVASQQPDGVTPRLVASG